MLPSLYTVKPADSPISLLGVQRNTLHSGEHVEMKSYMDQMDEELARTSIGESFEKVNVFRMIE